MTEENKICRWQHTNHHKPNQLCCTCLQSGNPRRAMMTWQGLIGGCSTPLEHFLGTYGSLNLVFEVSHSKSSVGPQSCGVPLWKLFIFIFYTKYFFIFVVAMDEAEVSHGVPNWTGPARAIHTLFSQNIPRYDTVLLLLHFKTNVFPPQFSSQIIFENKFYFIS